MKKYLIFSLLLSSICVYSQVITVKILGQHSYVVESESFGAIITLEEDPNKCDPNKGYISIEDQFKHLSESIVATGSSSILLPVDNYQYTGFYKKAYRIEEVDADLFSKIMEVCEHHEAKVDRRYYKIPPHDFVSEDANAIAALNDAKSKAEEISGHINYRVNKILNIDDDTRTSSEYFQKVSNDPKKMEQLESLIEVLNHKKATTESNRSTRTGQYNIWVTFEIVPN